MVLIPMNHRIKIPNSHWSLGDTLLCNEAHTANIQNQLMPSVFDNSCRVFKSHWLWKNHGYQHYCVDASLIPMFEATNCGEIDPASLKWPFESILLIFPRSYPIQTAIISNDEKLKGITITAVHQDQSDYCFAAEYEGEHTMAAILKDTPTLQKVDEKIKKEYKQLTGEDMPEDKPENVQQELREMVRMCISCLAFMNAKPEHIWQDPTLIQYPKKHKKDQRPWVAPRWLGKHFTSKSSHQHNNTTTSPAYSVSAHWRRGHWRHQHFGPKTDSKVKLIWLEPVFVGVTQS